MTSVQKRLDNMLKYDNHLRLNNEHDCVCLCVCARAGGGVA